MTIRDPGLLKPVVEFLLQNRTIVLFCNKRQSKQKSAVSGNPQKRNSDGRVEKILRLAGKLNCLTYDVKQQESMCVSIPGKVIAIKGKRAKIKQAEHHHWVDVSALEDSVREGDYLIIYQGAAINKISSEQAEEILGLLGKPVSEQRR